ncbi:hypothetical protein MAL08_02910 [Leptospira noguchii]|uniref:Uncharacterized protein n=1 Tax=Leptospira noguchii TaxID=28182 RepID=A0AAE9K9D5_9LEPT|nr:hypothetical protein [Leptospira noguchii]UOG31029.1 hypothetical protein MAL06_02880 [Leptospira noguchii]UOG31294.1 hypothetical protein MAL06_04395 [Leptospira noguchii]UOG37724.1 hypothetical protein MAL08_17205 [Leptospira noguchii]UOG38310.1 hypothetical protein MAL08_02910 [Leptospira noguchii]UOG44417.1 hypothetical protein MAL01_13540 [Leptospira noguchii]
MGRVNSAKRFLWVALTQQNASYGSRFRVNKLNLKTIVVLCFLYAIY